MAPRSNFSGFNNQRDSGTAISDAFSPAPENRQISQNAFADKTSTAIVSDTRNGSAAVETTRNIIDGDNPCEIVAPKKELDNQSAPQQQLYAAAPEPKPEEKKEQAPPQGPRTYRSQSQARDQVSDNESIGQVPSTASSIHEERLPEASSIEHVNSFPQPQARVEAKTGASEPAPSSGRSSSISNPGDTKVLTLSETSHLDVFSNCEWQSKNRVVWS